MRFSFASVALLALAHLLAPGVHGAPAVVAVRQIPSPLDALVSSAIGILGSLLGSATPIPAGLAEQLAQIAQELQNTAASGLLARAPSSSESTSSTTLFPTTTSHVLTVSTDRIGKSTVSSVASPQASSTPQTRIRRQLPPVLPTSVLSAVPGIVPSQTLPLQSILASVLSVASGKLGSVPSQSTMSTPTPSKH